MADMSDAPICPSCLHPHYPDVRCHICGHKGKGNSFRLPKFLGSDHRLHFENFNSANSNVSWSESVSRWQALSNLARIIRRDVFVTDLHIPENLEFDEHENFESTRHTIGFLGDAPVCYARWRLAEVSGSTCALLDRICVKQGYRMRGIATSALQHIMQDVMATASGTPLAGLVTNVPVDAQEVRVKLSTHSFTQMGGDATNAFLERGVPHVAYCIALPAAQTNVAVGSAAQPPTGP